MHAAVNAHMTLLTIERMKALSLNSRAKFFIPLKLGAEIPFHLRTLTAITYSTGITKKTSIMTNAGAINAASARRSVLVGFIASPP